jgi:hypothetical protein
VAKVLIQTNCDLVNLKLAEGRNEVFKENKLEFRIKFLTNSFHLNIKGILITLGEYFTA